MDPFRYTKQKIDALEPISLSCPDPGILSPKRHKVFESGSSSQPIFETESQFDLELSQGPPSKKSVILK